jgi:hypothetical protein
LAALAEEVPAYAVTIQEKIDTLQQIMRSRMTSLTLGLGHNPEPSSVAAQKTRAAGVPGKPPAEPPNPMQVEVHQPDITAIELARRIVTPVAEPLSSTVIVLIGQNAYVEPAHQASMPGLAGGLFADRAARAVQQL